ncbi:hypothetical protein AB6A40_007639 [Gnathostoma spinigerum]|uniref:Uncharacterized protein n=1 Tax=Gnathostoma spinigerum TaxID=75299 RepID=A0ABD6ELT9_9BILA
MFLENLKFANPYVVIDESINDSAEEIPTSGEHRISTAEYYEAILSAKSPGPLELPSYYGGDPDSELLSSIIPSGGEYEDVFGANSFASPDALLDSNWDSSSYSSEAHSVDANWSIPFSESYASYLTTTSLASVASETVDSDYANTTVKLELINGEDQKLNNFLVFVYIFHRKIAKC